MLLEICANSYQSAINAQVAGADRIELCTDLSVGGLTPSVKLLKQVLNALIIPVFVLIRPRSGNFCYSNAEFKTMIEDIQRFKDLGCHGIVSGILKSDNTLDVERTKVLIEHSKPLPFTCHRAFDDVPNPMKALDQLIAIGVDRLLSSGQETSAELGLELLKRLKEKADGNLIILPGGGINPIHAKLFKEAGFKELHASAKAINNNQEIYSDTKKIKAILAAVK